MWKTNFLGQEWVQNKKKRRSTNEENLVVKIFTPKVRQSILIMDIIVYIYKFAMRPRDDQDRERPFRYVILLTRYVISLTRYVISLTRIKLQYP